MYRSPIFHDVLLSMCILMFITCNIRILLQGKSGKFDLLQHAKGVRSSRPFLLIKDVVQEIVRGPDAPRSPHEQQRWSRRLHHMFFCKSFVFNTQFVAREADAEETLNTQFVPREADAEETLSKAVQSFKAQCGPIPDFHPHLYFELSDELGWAEFLREVGDISLFCLSQCQCQQRYFVLDTIINLQTD